MPTCFCCKVAGSHDTHTHKKGIAGLGTTIPSLNILSSLYSLKSPCPEAGLPQSTAPACHGLSPCFEGRVIR